MQGGRMHTVSSFPASAVEPDQLSTIMADYLSLEHARVFRRLLVVRCGMTALILAVVGLGFGWLPPFASSFSAAVLLAVPAGAWVFELRRERRLARGSKVSPVARWM